MSALLIRTAGNATVTDLGRFTVTHRGIPANGAADQYSARAANILVGNDENAPLISTTAADLVFVTDTAMLLAVTGAPAQVRVDGTTRAQWTPFLVHAHSTVSITGITTGLHAYLAIMGTVVGEQFRGSVAPDQLLGVGARLASGDTVPVTDGFIDFEYPYLPLFAFEPDIPRFTHDWTLDVLDGPEAGQFGNDLATRLSNHTLAVGARSNHVGTRLDGFRPDRVTSTEILSRGVPLGAVEIPPAGDLIILGRGRPVTAGYPVVAVVTRTSRDRLGQMRPGDSVRLNPILPLEANASYIEQRQRLSRLTERVRTAFAAAGLHRSDHALPA